MKPARFSSPPCTRSMDEPGAIEILGVGLRPIVSRIKCAILAQLLRSYSSFVTWFPVLVWDLEIQRSLAFCVEAGPSDVDDTNSLRLVSTLVLRAVRDEELENLPKRSEREHILPLVTLNLSANQSRPVASVAIVRDPIRVHDLSLIHLHLATFFPDVKVKSIYLHDTRRELPDKMMEGDSGWVLQGVLSRASFRRQPLNDQKTFTVLSLHINDVYAEKRGIGKKLILTIRAVMLGENVDLVAGDFNGAAWRRDNSNNFSIIEEAFADCALPMPPGSTPLWRPGSIPGNWADVCGFLEPPESDRQWKVRLHGALSIHRDVLGLRPSDESCHHETWLHLDFVGRHDIQPQREKPC